MLMPDAMLLYPGNTGGKAGIHPGCEASLLQGSMHTHLHTHSQLGAQPLLTCFLEVGESQKKQEETHTDTRRTCKSCVVTWQCHIFRVVFTAS